MTQHREELQRAVRVLAADSFLAHSSDYFGFVYELALIRDVHRAVGDVERVAHWQRILDRHLAAFAEPQKRLLLALMIF